MIRILFIQPYASHVGGVDSVLLQLIAGLDPERYRSYVLLSGPSPYVAKYEALGAEVLFGPLAVFGKPTDAAYYFRNLWILLRSLRAIRAIVRTYGIDLIHSHKMEAIGANLVGKCLGIPTVQTVHELARKPLFAYRFVAWLDHAFNDKVIVLCERSKIMFRWFNRESDKLTKIYNGIAVQEAPVAARTDLRDQLGLSPDDRIVIAVARLSPMKGLEYLIEAASALKETEPRLKFVIVGDVAFEHEMPYKQTLQKRIESQGLERTVFMLGLRRDVPELLRESDALVLPSVYDIFPTVILEGMDAGLPVIATDVGGVPEMVREGTGLIVPPQDSEALRAAIVRLFSLEYRQMGRRGREVFRREFTRDQYVQRTTEVYEELLARRRAVSTS
ncbi:glycosyltransferase family 4 protein [Cohnella nanjingensis]|uniref:Glycosyltransferase family 4 protein n=1 Tax=Cohnella nanjingensis TaxID=1387779 RepID=A0A7X0RQA8_9BACL|nr:glycosyltransferase family 4 protein [Cohnella nanjingensis]MBB6671687.1 glycosyltransferase family 4 protein [Cohnella nanjingensis]